MIHKLLFLNLATLIFFSTAQACDTGKRNLINENESSEINVSKPPSGEDKFNFLAQQYHHLLEKSAQPFELCDEETKHYYKLQSMMKSSPIKEPENFLLDCGNKILNLKILECFRKDPKKFEIYNQEYLFPLEKKHPKHGYFNTFFSRIIKDHTFLEHLVLTAEYIYQVIKDEKGGTPLFLGRTPCLIQVAFEEILKQENDKDTLSSLVHLNFSGHPDALTKRESTFFKSDTNITRDIVTKEKLNHYFMYLDEKNILKAEKIFIIDILSSGSSLNSFLRILNAYYQERDCKLPSLTFLNLTQDMNWKAERKEFYTFEQIGDVSNKGLLHLPSDEMKNMKPFTISTYGIPLFEPLIKHLLDQDMFQEFLVHGIQYPAQKWTKDFDEQRKLGAKYHLPFYENLRKQFSFLIDTHKNPLN